MFREKSAIAGALLQRSTMPNDDDRTATKQDLNELRIELHGDLDHLRTELKGDMVHLRSELKGGIWICGGPHFLDKKRPLP